jgi:hypothetical protein
MRKQTEITQIRYEPSYKRQKENICLFEFNHYHLSYGWLSRASTADD